MRLPRITANATTVVDISQALSDSGIAPLNRCKLVYLGVADYVTVKAFQSSGGVLALDAASNVTVARVV